MSNLKTLPQESVEHLAKIALLSCKSREQWFRIFEQQSEYSGLLPLPSMLGEPFKSVEVTLEPRDLYIYADYMKP